MRSFITSTIRKQTDLSGMWLMTANGKTVSAYVPSCREMLTGFENYRGVSVYEREISAGGNLLFRFGGVSHSAEVSIDGTPIGSHNGAYTGFDLPLQDVESGTHRLSVMVDNSFGENSALSVPNDYMTYGGITRACQLEQVSELYIKSVGYIPKKVCGKWEISARAVVRSLSKSAELVSPRCEICGMEYAFEPAEVAAMGEAEFSARFSVGNAKEYTLSSPVLTPVRCVLSVGGSDIDDLIERVGFREIEIKGGKIYFGGEEIQLKGFNRHEEHGLFGCALPPAAMAQDIALIRDMGGNAVRTCHYPNDSYFLDLCDENGLLVWEESHARGLSEKQMRHPLFMKQSLDCIDEMIERDINHPCIFVWGLLNECASDTDYGRECYEKLIGRIRELDSSRPVTFATCRPGSEVYGGENKGDGDKCLDLCDIVSFNIYPGWYHDSPPDEFLAAVRKWAGKNGGEGKPFIVSEIGAGAIYGFRSRIKDKWSEERQAEILESQLSAVLADSAVSGVFIWQFCDGRVSSECFYGRPRTMNNKGIVDEYRRPKMAYDVVKHLFLK